MTGEGGVKVPPWMCVRVSVRAGVRGSGERKKRYHIVLSNLSGEETSIKVNQLRCRHLQLRKGIDMYSGVCC